MIKIDKGYYVYERFRLDNMTCFYVGKGKGRRYKQKSRNSHHDRIANKYGFITKIYKDHLSEDEALKIENERICYYVFDLGYGIDIDGYRNESNNTYLTNSTFGGQGSNGVAHTQEWKEAHSKRMSGSGNPMYGIDIFHKLSIDEQNRIRKNRSEANSGKNNPMYGISPKERMTPKKYNKWLENIRKREFNGSNNPNFGNNTLHEKVKDSQELRIQYYSRPKEQNGRAREIYVYDLSGNLINRFDYIGECAEWVIKQLNSSSKVSSVRCSIITSIKQNKPYQNYKFSYYKL